jgi:hypothetical protein
MRTHGWRAALAVLAFAALAGVADAREGVKTSVTIKEAEAPSGQEYLGGKVKSPKAKCRRNRNVVLYWDAPGPPAGFQNVADDASNRRGAWRINAPGVEIPPGEYYVKVTPIERRGDTCKRAKSETITVSFG